jgi:ABC-2 type transport system ATP-binding protein
VSSELVVDVAHLGRTFGKLVAVRDVSLQVRRGEIFGVLGPNGAGKSTTIRMLCGILDPSTGGGRVAGFDLVREAEQVKSRIGYMTQRFSLYEDLTVEENMRFYAGIYSLPRARARARIDALIASTGLHARRHQLAATLSGGWKQRVALACATIHEPPLLFLDEPTAGVDPVSRREFWNQIHRVAAAGTTVLVTTHYMDEAERCHRLAFIFRGEVLAEGSPDQIVANSQLSVAEVETPRATDVEAAVRTLPDLEDVTLLGGAVRVALRESDAVARVQGALEAAQVPFERVRAGRASVEDAFIAMVRNEERRSAGAA